jgi:hypothetical protein
VASPCFQIRRIRAVELLDIRRPGGEKRLINQRLKGVTVNNKDFAAESRSKNEAIAKACLEVDNIRRDMTPSTAGRKNPAHGADAGA